MSKNYFKQSLTQDSEHVLIKFSSEQYRRVQSVDRLGGR